MPINCFSSDADPIPGTWIRILSAPCFCMVGSRVPTSSIRRRIISKACCIVRSSVARLSTSLNFTIRSLFSPITSRSNFPTLPMLETGLASVSTNFTASLIASGLDSLILSSFGSPFCNRIVPTLARSLRSKSRTSGHKAAILCSYTSAT